MPWLSSRNTIANLGAAADPPAESDDKEGTESDAKDKDDAADPGGDGDEKEKIDWDQELKNLKKMSSEDGEGDASESETEDEAEEAPAPPPTPAPEPMVPKSSLVRMQADFENFRRRSDVEKAQLSAKTKGKMMKSLVALIDNFDRANDGVKPQNEGEEKIKEGYNTLYKQMMDILTGLGLRQVDPMGKKYDPNTMEAVMMEENEDVEDETVLEVFGKGFMYEDDLLRAAMVKVSQNPNPPAVEENAEPFKLPGQEEEKAEGEAEAEPKAEGQEESEESKEKT